MSAAEAWRVVSLRERARRERILIALGLLWLLFLFNFTAFAFGSGDAGVQYNLARRIFGDTGYAEGYYFGLALLELPFYALGKLLEVVGIHTIAGTQVEVALISIGMGLLVIPGVALLVWILGKLQVPASATVLLGAVFGTPLFYYAVFQPGKNHLSDALLFACVIALVLLYFRSAEPGWRAAAAIGALLGVSMTVRYFAGPELVPLVAVLLWLRRWRDASLVVIGAAATFLVLVAIPKAYGVGIFTGGSYSPGNVLIFAPLNPLRMLFTDHRGFLIWSPVAIIGTVGYIRLLRTRPEHRRFLGVAGAMGLSIVASYAFIPFWDGTFSFSNRFLTPLFALVAIGLAGAFEAWPRAVSVLTTLCVAWSLFLCFNLQTIEGWRFFERKSNGATTLAALPRDDHLSAGAYAWGIYRQSRLVRSWVPWPGSTPAGR